MGLWPVHHRRQQSFRSTVWRVTQAIMIALLAVPFSSGAEPRDVMCAPHVLAAYRTPARAQSTSIHDSGAQLTEPIARVLQFHMKEVGWCQKLLSRRADTRGGALNMQVALDAYGRVMDVCVLEDGLNDPPTVRCMMELLEGMLFPPGAFPTVFRWRVMFQVDR